MLSESNQKKILVQSFLFEMISQDSSVADYKQLMPKSGVESFFLEKADDEDSLFLFSLYIGFSLLNKDSLRKAEIKSPKGLKKDINIDILAILPFMTSFYFLFEAFSEKHNETRNIEKLTPLRTILESFYELGQEISSFYSKENDFLTEVDSSFSDLIQTHEMQGFDEKIEKVFLVYKNSMDSIEKNGVLFFDFTNDIANRLFPFKYDFLDNEKSTKTLASDIIYSNNPFIYISGNRDNFSEQFLLYFIQKKELLENNDYESLLGIHRSTHALLFSVYIKREHFNRQMLKDLSSHFFFSNDKHGKSAMLDKEIHTRSKYFERIYNYKTLESSKFKQSIMNELEKIYNESNADITMTLKTLSLRLPKIAKENKWFIGEEKDEELHKDLSKKLFKFMIDFIEEQRNLSNVST